jgi:Matrixin
VTESITPRPNPTPEIKYQPSMLSLRSAAATVPPEDQSPISAQQARKPATWRKLWFFAALSAIAAVAGAGALSGRDHVSADVRSGSPGFKKTPQGKDLHWENKTLTIYLDDSLQHIGPGASEAVMQAFGQWVASDQRLPDLSFDTGQTSPSPKQDGKSTVSYARITAPGHEHDVAITVTYANDQTGAIIEADIVLNALYPMGALTAKTPAQTSPGAGSHDDGKDRDESLDCRNRYDAQNVATHEAGHFFGLGEDLTEKRATMFLSIDHCETHKRALATTDTTALGTLYAESADPTEASAGPKACSLGGVPQGSGALAVSAGILGLTLLRRRRSR